MKSTPHLVNSDINIVNIQPRQLLDGDSTFHLPLSRSKTGGSSLVITLTNEERSRQEALALINRRYAWRGYGSDHKLSGRHEEITFSALFEGQLVGTVTLGADTGRDLAVDATFPEEMQFFRRKPNTRLCELKKLALEHSSDSKPVLGSLFHFVFIYGTNNYLGTDLLIEVNPRHASFYERMLGFRRVGAIKTNVSVNAPSQLMWLPVSDIEESINRRQEKAYNSSLYKYFYPECLADRIVNQLNERGIRDCIERQA